MCDALSQGCEITDEQTTAPIEYANNLVKRGIPPPDLYQMPYSVYVLTTRAIDLLKGHPTDPTHTEE